MSTSAITIRPLTEDDFAAWLPLWQGYLRFYQTDLDEATTQNTWQNLLADENKMNGFAAWQTQQAASSLVDGNISDAPAKLAAQKTMVGMVHTVRHPNTWSSKDYCYLEDLFVAPSGRGQGVGRALIEHVYEFAKQQRCARVYWTTQQHNLTARHLYDDLAAVTDMVQYRHNL